jgi:hypothetical protein
LNRLSPGEGLPLEPSICFICESSPQTGAVDTFRTNDTHVPTKLRGRKYVCISCIEELGKFIGMAPEKDMQDVVGLVTEYQTALAEAKLRVEQLEAVHVDMLKDLLAKATKPAVTKTSVSPTPNGC